MKRLAMQTVTYDSLRSRTGAAAPASAAAGPGLSRPPARLRVIQKPCPPLKKAFCTLFRAVVVKPPQNRSGMSAPPAIVAGRLAGSRRAG